MCVCMSVSLLYISSVLNLHGSAEFGWMAVRQQAQVIVYIWYRGSSRDYKAKTNSARFSFSKYIGKNSVENLQQSK